MINYCLCTVWKKALQTKYVVNFSERERGKEKKIAKTFLCFFLSILHELHAHFFTLCFLAIIDFTFFPFFFLFAHCSLCFYLALCVFHAIFFLAPARLFVSVVFQHPLMALSITFHLFIILLTNSHFSIHTFLYIYAFALPVLLLLFNFTVLAVS